MFFKVCSALEACSLLQCLSARHGLTRGPVHLYLKQVEDQEVWCYVLIITTQMFQSVQRSAGLQATAVLIS